MFFSNPVKVLHQLALEPYRRGLLLPPSWPPIPRLKCTMECTMTQSQVSAIKFFLYPYLSIISFKVFDQIVQKLPFYY